jgi:hypothetical protein
MVGLYSIGMNKTTQMFKRIGETIKMNVIQAPHPTLVGIGISLAITAVIAVGIAALSDPSHMAHAAFWVRRTMPSRPMNP